MFRGHDLEFNAMTKHFYTDRSLPKKRLSEDDMVEINRLYRIIGMREQELAQLHAGPSPTAAAETSGSTAQRGPIALYVVAGALLAILAIVIVARRRDS